MPKPKIFGSLSHNIVFLKILTTPTKNVLQKLDSSSFFKETDAYLAGGTALALHIGHRYSYDLDFFTPKEFQAEVLVQLIQKYGQFKIENTSWQTIIGTFEGIKFSLFYYQYPLLSPLTKIFTNANIASRKDIAAMKVAAIVQRGTKRDFIDLYFLLKNFTLKQALDLYSKKFQSLGASRTHVLKSLVYFADAEGEPMPQLTEPLKWQKVKELILKKAQELIKIEVASE